MKKLQFETRIEKGIANKKYPDGACQNCGGTDHKTKFCYERPKKAPVPQVTVFIQYHNQQKKDNTFLKVEEKKKQMIEEQKRNTQKSKYIEDQYIGEHNQIWGSYWNEVLGWGFACCFSNKKTNECLGEKGKRQSLTKEYLLKRQIEETPLVDQQLKSGPINLNELYSNSNLREGAPLIGPLQEKIDQQ
ncbi:hypothetical protein pb186bvf_020150 [Paramecium bursaria]